GASLVCQLQCALLMRTIGRTGIVTLSIIAALVQLGGSCALTYNKLVRLDQAAKAQWAQVENTYQRRADLVPNLVETVKGAAAFEIATAPPSFPTSIVVGLLGGRFPEKQYFTAKAGSDVPPQVRF